MRIATVPIALLMAAGLILLPILLRLPMPIKVGSAPERTSQDAMVVTHDIRTGVLVEKSDVRIVVVSRTLITPDIPRKRSEVFGHKPVRPIQEGHLIHLSEVSQ